MREKIARLLFSNRTLGQTVVKNIFWLSISEMVSRLLRVIVVIYAARVLGVAGYGMFSNALAIAGLIGVFADWGIGSIFIREVAKAASLRSKYISTILSLRLGLLAVMALAILFVAPLMTNIPEARELLPFMALLLLFDGLRNFSFVLIRALELMELEAGLSLFANAAFMLAAIGFLLNDPTPRSLALGYVLGSALGLAATLYILRGRLREFSLGFAREWVVPILDSAWPLVVSTFFGAILMYTDIIMLGWLRTAQDLGWYSAAQKPVQLLAIIPTILAVSLLPAMSRLLHRDPEKFRSVTEQAMAITVGLALPLAVGGLLMGNQLIALLYGPSYAQAGPIFSVLVIYLVSAFPAAIIYNAVLADNLQKKFLPPIVLGAVANIALNLWLIPRLGGLGAASATAISQIVAQVILYHMAQAVFRFQLLTNIKKIILATTVMGLVIFGLQRLGISFWISLPAAIVVYFGSLVVTRETLLEKLKSILAERETGPSA